MPQHVGMPNLLPIHLFTRQMLTESPLSPGTKMELSSKYYNPNTTKYD